MFSKTEKIQFIDLTFVNSTKWTHHCLRKMLHLQKLDITVDVSA